MNNYFGYQNGYGYQGQSANNFAPPQPTTNKIYVTSLEDAMARYAGPNSTMIYVLQDESTVFEIYTDLQGKKVPKVRKLVDFVPEQSAGAGGGDFVRRAEFEALAKKIEALTGERSEA